VSLLWHCRHHTLNQFTRQQGGPTLKSAAGLWTDRHSTFVPTNERAVAEEELLSLAPSTSTTVLNLCGLWGGSRSVKNLVGRVAPTKEALKSKGSIHMIHGEDVSRAILAIHERFHLADGERWLLTDGRVYDWWDLASAWGTVGERPRGKEGGGEEVEVRGPQAKWTRELMNEEGVRALPRSPEQLGRAYDSREFWDTFELEPVRGRLD